MSNPYFSASDWISGTQIRAANFQAEFDAIEAGFDAIYASTGGGATSATSQTVGAGSKTFILTTGSFVIGQYVTVASTLSPENLMFGQVTAMNTTTGACTVNVVYTTGAGTISAWTISLSPPGTLTFTPSSADTLTNKTINLGSTTFTGGAVPVAAGGTNLASYAVGDLIYASGATTLAKLADVATGNVLISGGVGVAPAWGKVGLTTHISGTLPIANGGTGSTSTTYCSLSANVTGTLPATNGGTGQTSFAVGDLLYASTTTAISKLADVATGNVLISGGVGVAPAWGKVGLATHITGTLPIANGGTNLTSTPTNGQLMIGNGTGYTLATVTAGSGISVTNGAGSITIANAITQTVSANSMVMGPFCGGAAAGALYNTVFGSGGSAGNASGWALDANGGDGNSLFGYVAGRDLTTGSNNTLMGRAAGYQITTGSINTLIGYNAGNGFTSGSSNNTIVGPYSGAGSVSSLVALADGAGTRKFWHDNTDAFVLHATTASAANAYLDSATNKLQRSTSSVRYKRDIEDLWESESAKLLDLKPILYRSKCDGDRSDWSHYGVLAEQAHEVGLQRLVQYEYLPEDYGEPDENNERWPKEGAQKVPGGFAYDRMSVLLLDLVQRHEARIAALEAAA